MTVRKDMVNGHDICHGGLVFSLADSAFAFSCNSYNRVTVALAASIEFLAPARLGDHLTAESQEQALGGKTGVYDVVVSNQDDRRLALFRGKSYRLNGAVIPEDDS
jgi:acyl-CoA thioesterase